MAETKRKQLHYRLAEFFAPTGRSLQDMVEEALRKLNKIKDRKEAISDPSNADSWQRFINTHRSAMSMEFGALIMLAPGQNKLLIETDDDHDEAELSHIVAPDNKEFLESILFYGIKDNHVLLVQSLNLKARELENHLNWLLREAGIIDNDNIVYLNNYAPKEIYDKLESNPIKSVRIGSELCQPADMVTPSNTVSQNEDTKKISIKRSGIGLDILTYFIPSRIDEISKDLGDTSNIEVFIEVTYKRQTDDESQKALNQITQALRHSSEEDLKIELKNGVTINGSEVKIKTFKSIASVNGNLDVSDVFSQIRTWLEELLSKGLVS